MKNGIWTRIPSYGLQHHTIREALHTAEIFIRASRVLFTPEIKARVKLIGLAYLNRACELACVPLAQYYAESPSGLDLVWITYRPEAILDNPGSIPGALVYLDSVDNMTEDQARARALGY